MVTGGRGAASEEPGELPLETRVQADQLAFLYAKGSAPYFISILNAFIFLGIGWAFLPGRGARLLGWFATVVGVNLVRILLRARYRAAPEAERADREWVQIAIGGSFVHGLIWGATAIILFPSDLAGQVVLAFVLAGMSAAAATLSSSYLLAYFAYGVPALAPLFVRFAIGPDLVHRLMAVQIALFFIGTTLMARASRRSLSQAFVLSHQLAATTHHLAELNETLETRVQARTEELERALAVRDEFLIVASHELKTPLTALRMQLQLMQKDCGKLGVRGRRKIDARVATLQRQSVRLTGLVATLLDVALLADDRLPITPVETDAALLIRRVAAEMNDELGARGSRLQIDLPERLPGRWDPVRVEQILVNLLSNAGKYGAGEAITIAARPHRGGLSLIVRDRGRGISTGELPRIFGKYERASSAHGHGGLGLGLFIVHELVEAMRGEIDVESQQGLGTSFSVWLPSA